MNAEDVGTVLSWVLIAVVVIPLVLLLLGVFIAAVVFSLGFVLWWTVKILFILSILLIIFGGSWLVLSILNGAWLPI